MRPFLALSSNVSVETVFKSHLNYLSFNLLLEKTQFHMFDRNMARCRLLTHQAICPILNDFSMIKIGLETISLRNLTLKKLASLAYDVFSRYVSMFNAVWVHSSRSKIDL